MSFERTVVNDRRVVDPSLLIDFAQYIDGQHQVAGVEWTEWERNLRDRISLALSASDGPRIESLIADLDHSMARDCLVTYSQVRDILSRYRQP